MDIEILRRDDGSPWELGAGAFGKVRAPCESGFPPPLSQPSRRMGGFMGCCWDGIGRVLPTEGRTNTNADMHAVPTGLAQRLHC